MMWVFTFISDNDEGRMLGSGKEGSIVSFELPIVVLSGLISLASKLTFLIVQYFTGRML